MTLVATPEEIAQAWTKLDNDNGLIPRPEWFGDQGRAHIGQLGIDHERRLKSEFTRLALEDVMFAGETKRKRFFMANWKLIGEGVAIGIKIGIEIGRLRVAAVREEMEVEFFREEMEAELGDES